MGMARTQPVSLAQMFADGQADIPTVRRGQLFSELEERALTAQEKDIIAKRLALQRRMLEAYELREQQRQVEAVMQVSSDLSKAEALYALQQHSNREEETIAAITSSPAFRRQVRAACAESTTPSATGSERVSAAAQNCANLPEVPLCTSKGKRSARRSGRQGLILKSHFCQPGKHTYQSSTSSADPMPRRTSKPYTNPTVGRAPKPYTHPIVGTASTGGSSPSGIAGVPAAVEGGAEAAAGDAGLAGSGCQPVLAAGQAGEMQAASDQREAATGQLELAAGQAGGMQAPSDQTEGAAGQEGAARTLSAGVQKAEQGEEEVLGAFPEARNREQLAASGRTVSTSNSASPEAGDALRTLESSTGHLLSGCDNNDDDNCGKLSHAGCLSAQASTPAEGRRPSRRASQGVAQLLQSLREAPRVQQELARAAREAAGKRERSKDAAATGKGKDGRARVKREKTEGCRNSAAAGRVPRASDAPARKPRLGRVKKCSSKQVELLRLGRLRVAEGWFNRGYIFPEGYAARTTFRSSTDVDAICSHECSILGRKGCFWPLPTFQILAADTPVPINAKSATGAWSGILARINAAIKARGQIPPGTAIPGPEFFGLTTPDIVEAIEDLDEQHSCAMYWEGKQDRQAYSLLHGTAPERKGVTRSSGPGKSDVSKRARTRTVLEDEGDDTIYAASVDTENGSDSDLDGAALSRWSGVDRAARFRRRHGDAPSDKATEAGNPLPGVLDPITLEQVRRPAMSPSSGHVMGMATWAAVLAEHGRCPFTQQPLHKEQLTVLTPSNIEHFRDRLILQ